MKTIRTRPVSPVATVGQSGTMSRALAAAAPPVAVLPPGLQALPQQTVPLGVVAPLAQAPQLDARGATVMLAAPTFQQLAAETEQRQQAALRAAFAAADAGTRASMAAVARMQALRDREAQEQQDELARLAPGTRRYPPPVATPSPLPALDPLKLKLKDKQLPEEAEQSEDHRGRDSGQTHSTARTDAAHIDTTGSRTPRSRRFEKDPPPR